MRRRRGEPQRLIRISLLEQRAKQAERHFTGRRTAPGRRALSDLSRRHVQYVAGDCAIRNASSPGSPSPAPRSWRAGTASRGQSRTGIIRDYGAILRKVFEPQGTVMTILHMNPRLPTWLGTGTEAMELTAGLARGT
jgi:hypothetical protein